MKVMYIRHKLGAMSPLLPDEALVYRVEQPRAIVNRCAHSLGVWTYPMITNLAVSTTDRRVLISCSVLPPFRMELDLWFAGCGTEERLDTIVSASFDSGHWGPCVEICSVDPKRKRSIFSAPELATRVYCEEAEEMAHIITDLACRNRQTGEHVR